MNDILILLFALLCLGLLVEGFLRRGAVYEYPFLAGAMSTAFILPQLPGLSSDIFLPADGFAKALAFTIVCLAMAAVGWRCSARPLLATSLPLLEGRLLIASALLSIAGAGFYVAVGRLPPETMVSTAISGAPVILLFFSKMLVVGFAIAVLCAARRLSVPAVVIVLCDSALYLDRVLVTGKRGEAFEFLLIIALAFWFQRRRALPRAAVILTVIVGMFLMASTQDYRDITRRGVTPGVEDIARIDFAGNFERLLEEGSGEFENLIMRIDLVSRNQSFDYGMYHWNETVMAFVPAQIVGEATKRSLLVETPGAIDRFYQPHYGTTETGMADAFGSFGYLGFVKFLFVGWLMRKIYLSAMHGDAASQLAYMLSALPAMHIFSHHTNWIVAASIHMGIFLGPALLFAHERRRSAIAATA